MPEPQAQDQSLEDLVKQYGGTVAPEAGPPAGQPSSDQSLEDLVKQYGGTVEPSTGVDVLSNPAASRYSYSTPEGVPVYYAAPSPPPAGAPPNLPPPPESAGATVLRELVVNPAKQVGSAFMGAASGASHLAANLAGLFANLDAGVQKTAGITGSPSADIFRHIENWARGQQQAQQQQAQELSGGRQDLPSQLIREGAGAGFSLPAYGVATALGGPVGGMAAMGGLETADQGWKNAATGAVEGMMMGGVLHVMGPAKRWIRVAGNAAVTYQRLRDQGVDNETALRQALLQGGLGGMGPGEGTGLREMAGNIPQVPGMVGEAIKEKVGLPVRSTLNPAQQAGVNYMLSQGVPLTASQITGSPYLKATEAITAHQPFGAEPARRFTAGTQEAITGLSQQLAGEVHPEPVTPYEGGKAAGDALDRQISELNLKENDAYKDAWQHAGKPEFTEKVPVRKEPVVDESGQPTGQTKDVYDDVNMPVDVRWMKDIARREIPKYEYGLSTLQQETNKTYTILKKILSGPDHITAEQAEESLKGLKAEARGAESPDLRNVSQGTAAQLIPELQRGVNGAVAKTGQEAIDGLLAGRKLHAQKMEIADIADKLRGEPVKAFDQLTAARDSGVDYLKQIADRAPGVMPKLGRAYLENLFDMATAEGGWSRAAGIFRKWEALGDQTKAMLFPNASQRQALDRFFLSTKMIGEPINPSGTAMVGAAKEAGVNPFKWAYGWAGSKLFFTPKGIKFLTGVAQNPPRTAADSAAVRAQAKKIFGPPNEPPEGPGEPPGGPGGPPPPSGGPPPPGAPPGGPPPPPGSGAAPPDTGSGPEAALKWAQAQTAAGNVVKSNELQRRFRLGYGAAQKILKDVQPPGPTEGGGGT